MEIRKYKMEKEKMGYSESDMMKRCKSSYDKYDQM